MARHESSPPWVATATGVPAIASRVRDGTNASSTRNLAPRLTTATLFDAEIGAPQRGPQHQEERASGTRADPVLR
jgi:hypothetical protein